MINDIIAVVIVIIIAFLIITGLSRIIRQKGKSYRWRYAGKHYAAREEVEVTGLRAIISGIIRIIIAVILIYVFSQIFY